MRLFSSDKLNDFNKSKSSYLSRVPTSHRKLLFRMLKRNTAQMQGSYKACERFSASIDDNKCAILYMLLNFTWDHHAWVQILRVQKLCLYNAPENETGILT